MNYLILSFETVEELQKEVIKYLEQGYTLAGGVSVTQNVSGVIVCYCQAVVLIKS